MRNQRKTVLIFIGIFVVTQLINQLVSVPLPSLGDNPNPSLQDIIDALSKVEPTALIGSFVFQQLLMSFIATFGIATIHHISQQNQNPINQGLMLTLRRFLGVVVLDIFMSLPLLFGMVDVVSSFLSKNAHSPLAFVSMVFGLFVFVRLCLSPVHYIASNQSIGQSALQVWRAGVKRNGILIIYALITYLLLPLLVNSVGAILGTSFLSVIFGILVALFQIFILVFTYRFYSLFMKA
ncbi:beta-methylgalactoside transporter [Haemophilus sp. UMB1048]|uniref:beta-methylgalactoside transporter n=1 Tax=Haemophilus sp. UMB1048 TaxID=3046322 RepID=UPI00255531B8|nr:beta-methylgalactoside transporter [Haemophilus sp. UMB1048]MDK7255021.1 beta-methylgalactoside transporter [Haemophilus sp. UMB1048]